VSELLDALENLFQIIGKLLAEQQGLVLPALLLVAWVAWWLWAVNWKKAWPVLAAGGWVPLVLLMVVAALAWSRLAPSDCSCLGFVSVANFWWQLGEIGLFVAVALFCGWLQGHYGWTPAEVDLEPPAHEEHGHGSAHGHH
jgi:hypothetical protein